MKLENIKNKLIDRSKNLTITRLIVITALFLVFFGNMTFFRHILEVYQLNLKNWVFILSIGVVLTSFIVIILSLLSFRRTYKPVLIIFFMLSSVTAYFMDNYNVVIDHIMIQNSIETNAGEAFDLFSIKLVLYILFLGVLPSVLVFMVKTKTLTLKKSILYKLRDISLSFIVIITVIFGFGKYYTSFFREHKPLRYYANPVYPIYSAGKFMNMTLDRGNKEFKKIGTDAKIVEEEDEDKMELVILVVGEAARADHFSLNGYNKETNPLLSRENVINFTNVHSCGTSTAYSVPCMFSVFGRTDYSDKKGRGTENVLDVLSHTKNVEILWRDNNSDSKGVAERVQYENYRSTEKNKVCPDGECRDVGMLDGLDDYIEKRKGKDILIVLHQMGNHGPAYYKRYPKEFEVFKPVCRTNQLENCSMEEINNAYDNAILYTDYFLWNVIEFLKKYDKTRETAMIYMSDHGESLGENNIYLHGFPYSIAPKAQIHIPSIMWFGPEILKDINVKKVRQERNKQYTQDNLFHTLLGLFEVKTEIYDKEMDILHE